MRIRNFHAILFILLLTGVIQSVYAQVPPKGERRIQLEYSQVIKADSGLARYTYPLRTDQFTQQPTASLAVSIDIKSKHGLKTIYSPTHEVAVNRKDDNRATISYKGTNVQVLRDFACYYSLSDKDFGIDLITHPIRSKGC